jgi:hypothetical protein
LVGFFAVRLPTRSAGFPERRLKILTVRIYLFNHRNRAAQKKERRPAVAAFVLH